MGCGAAKPAEKGASPEPEGQDSIRKSSQRTAPAEPAPKESPGQAGDESPRHHTVDASEERPARAADDAAGNTGGNEADAHGRRQPPPPIDTGWNRAQRSESGALAESTGLDGCRLNSGIDSTSPRMSPGLRTPAGHANMSFSVSARGTIATQSVAVSESEDPSQPQMSRAEITKICQWIDDAKESIGRQIPLPDTWGEVNVAAVKILEDIERERRARAAAREEERQRRNNEQAEAQAAASASASVAPTEPAQPAATAPSAG
eukprot:TRINITY_DN66058_c0_g1_i1.p1 TRINITY_DN66058_c0_g1~~TRINITY_DN66058_c0_g1_i1.p1  ORF type:complete len:306 (+),score=41.85 TRINITY_DN66058_c0_g1_i1:133-918(+)